jgi:hypothetical protein
LRPVLLHANAVLAHQAHLSLRQGEALIRRRAKPGKRLLRIFGDGRALQVGLAHHELGQCIPAVRAAAIPLDRFRFVLLHAETNFVEVTQHRLRERIARVSTMPKRVYGIAEQSAER